MECFSVCKCVFFLLLKKEWLLLLPWSFTTNRENDTKSIFMVKIMSRMSLLCFSINIILHSGCIKNDSTWRQLGFPFVFQVELLMLFRQQKPFRNFCVLTDSPKRNRLRFSFKFHPYQKFCFMLFFMHTCKPGKSMQRFTQKFSTSLLWLYRGVCGAVWLQ